MASYTENEKLSNNPVLNKVRAAKRKFIEDNPITASSKALSKRGYNKYDSSWKNEPSTVAEYSQGIGTLDAEPKDEKGVNWFAAIANQPKIIAEYATELLPGARRILSPFGSVETTENLGDAWEGSKYHGTWDYFRNLKTTKLESDDFTKISKKGQSEENLIPYLENYLNGKVLTEEFFINELSKDLAPEGFEINSLNDIERYGKDNSEFKTYVTNFHKKKSEEMMTENDFYEDEDNYYVKNFKEQPGVNAAWTRYGDMQLPNLGIFKFDDQGQGSMMAPSASSYEGILGFDQLQDAGMYGMDETTSEIKYKGMFDQDNPSTQAATQLLGIPTSIATGNIKNILKAPTALGKVAQAGREMVKSPYTMGKLAWQNKGKVGAVAAPIGIASLWPE